MRVFLELTIHSPLENTDWQYPKIRIRTSDAIKKNLFFEFFRTVPVFKNDTIDRKIDNERSRKSLAVFFLVLRCAKSIFLDRRMMNLSNDSSNLESKFSTKIIIRVRGKFLFRRKWRDRNARAGNNFLK